jgi:beta-lactamase superfamily II metal-dependent hydrolase
MKRLAVTLVFLAALARSASASELQIFFVDVEGGQATLVVTPAGQSLLIDAGYGGARGSRDPDRILAAARDAGVERIDYLVITHFHGDHVGGVPELASRIPIDTFVDYGTPLGYDRMAIGGFRNYAPVRDQGKHVQPKPGDRLPLAGVEVHIVSASGQLLPEPLPGAGLENPGCATLEHHEEDGTENFRSIGVRVRFGRFRFVDVGDLSGNTLGRLVCPHNLVGEASVYLVAHHGNYDSNVPAVLTALRPLASVLNNGPHKGGAPESLATLRRQPDMDLWQLHESRNPRAQNAPPEFIANVDEGVTAYWIKLTAREDGSFDLFNSRTGFRKTYFPRARAH